MSYPILVEPADEHRRGFAQWCLAQDPPIMTASSHGSLVPVGLFKLIPDELLVGSYVEGHEFRPVVGGKVPDGDGYADEPRPRRGPAKKTTTRARRTRKADAQ